MCVSGWVDGMWLFCGGKEAISLYNVVGVTTCICMHDHLDKFQHCGVHITK